MKGGCCNAELLGVWERLHGNSSDVTVFITQYVTDALVHTLTFNDPNVQ